MAEITTQTQIRKARKIYKQIHSIDSMNQTEFQTLKCPKCTLVLATSNDNVDDLQRHLRTTHHESFAKNALTPYLFNEDEN